MGLSWCRPTQVISMCPPHWKLNDSFKLLLSSIILLSKKARLTKFNSIGAHQLIILTAALHRTSYSVYILTGFSCPSQFPLFKWIVIVALDLDLVHKYSLIHTLLAGCCDILKPHVLDWKTEHNWLKGKKYANYLIQWNLPERPPPVSDHPP